MEAMSTAAREGRRPPNRTCRPWTDDEDTALIGMWWTLKPSDIGARLGGRSADSVENRAHILRKGGRLPVHPEGYLGVTNAARRYHMSRTRLLHEAGAGAIRAIRNNGYRPHVYLNVEDVERLVARRNARCALFSDTWISTADGAALLGIGDAAFRKLAKREEIPTRFGSGDNGQGHRRTYARDAVLRIKDSREGRSP